MKRRIKPGCLERRWTCNGRRLSNTLKFLCWVHPCIYNNGSSSVINWFQYMYISGTLMTNKKTSLHCGLGQGKVWSSLWTDLRVKKNSQKSICKNIILRKGRVLATWHASQAAGCWEDWGSRQDTGKGWQCANLSGGMRCAARRRGPSVDTSRRRCNRCLPGVARFTVRKLTRIGTFPWHWLWGW